jgi:O-antigen ligase/Flp pilus assembly protein TadD
VRAVVGLIDPGPDDENSGTRLSPSACRSVTSRPRPHAVALSLLIGAGVLVMDPAGWSPYGPAKWMAVVIVALTGLALALARRQVALTRRALVAWIVFLVWVGISAATGLDPRLAWLGTPQRHFGALTWLLCAGMWAAGHSLDDDGDGRLVAGVAAAVGGLAGLWSIAELAGWQPVRLAASDRLVGPLGSAAYLGAAEALLVPIAVGVAADRGWRPADRGLAAACAGFGTVALIGSGARAAWCGGITAVAVLGWIHREKLRGRVLPLLLVAVIGSAGVVGLAFATGTAARLPEAFEGGPGGSSRLAEWRVATRVLVSHPLTGVGPEGYRIAFGAAVDASYQREYGRDPLPDRAHDSLLDVAVTTGFPGVAAYVALLALVGVFAWRAMRRGPPWLAGVAAGLVAYAAGALLLFPIAELEPSVWLFAGLVSIQTAGDTDLVGVTLPRWTRATAAAAVTALTGVALVLGVEAVRADQLMRTALDRQSPVLARRAVELAPDNIVNRVAAAEIDAAAGSPAAGLTEVDAGLRVSPKDPVLADEKATLLLQASNWRAAAADLSALIPSDPRNPTLRLELGVAEANLDQRTAAGVQLTIAADLDPTSGVAQTDLALLYEQEGHPAEARQAALAALKQDPTDAEAAALLSELPGNHGT